MDFERPFVYLELFAGQATLATAACSYARSIGFKQVVAFAVECQDPDDIEGSTRDPDVIWITRKIEQLDTTSLLGHIRTVCYERFKVSSLIPVIVGHASPMCTAHSLVNTTGDRRNVPYDQALAATGIRILQHLCDDSFSVEQPATSAMLSSEVIYGLVSHTAMETQYPIGKLDLHEGKSHRAVYYGDYDGAQRKPSTFLVPIRCDTVVYPPAKVKSRVKIPCPPSDIPPSLAHEIVKRIIDYRLSLGRESTFLLTPCLSTILKVTHRRMPVSNPNSDIKEHVLRLSFAGRKTMVVKKNWGEVLRLGSKKSYRRHIKLKVDGKDRRFDMQRVLLSAIFPSVKARENAFDHMAVLMAPRLIGGDYGANSLDDDILLVDGGRITTENVDKYPLCDVPVAMRPLAPGFIQCPNLRVSQAVAVRLRLPHCMVSMKN
jgi:hypothetical protein